VKTAEPGHAGSQSGAFMGEAAGQSQPTRSADWRGFCRPNCHNPEPV